MPYFITFIVSTLIAFIATWLGIAYVVQSLDPTGWPEGARFAHAGLTIIFGGMFTLFSAEP